MRSSYERMKYCVAASLVLYCVIGIGIKLFTNGAYKGEIYPFFSWFLFAEIPKEHYEYRMEMLSLGDVTYDPPLPFSETRDIFLDLGRSPTEYIPLIQELGTAVVQEQGDQIAVSRARVETMFSGASGEYRILRVLYDPLRYWNTGQYVSEEEIARFSTGS